MKKKTALKLLKACEEFLNGWEHFCNCIDFAHSALDADATRFMNEAPAKIGIAAGTARGEVLAAMDRRDRKCPSNS